MTLLRIRSIRRPFDAIEAQVPVSVYYGKTAAPTVRMKNILATYFVCFLTFKVKSTPVDFTVSPGVGRQKKMELSFTQRSWFDALDICKQRGFETLLWSSKNLETFKTVRKATITKRGTSNIEVWTSFLHFNYTWMSESEWRVGHTCSLMNGYTITSAEPHPQQCSHAHLTDTGDQVSLHESKCSDVRYFVCYKFTDTPLEMSVYEDTLFDYNSTSLRVVYETPNTLDGCMDLCVAKRYCVTAVFHHNDVCVTVWYYVERELVLAASTGVAGYTLGVKFGDVVSFASTAISPIGNITELPCVPANTNLLSSTTSAAEQATSTSQVYTTSGTTETLQTSFTSSSHVSATVSSQTTPSDLLFSTGSITPTPHSTSTGMSISTLEYVSTSSVQLVPETTTFSIQNITCTCACTSSVLSNYSFNELRVNKNLLSSYTRRKTSAYDGRLSSKVIGVSGAIIIVTVISVIVLLDLLNIVRAMKNIPMV